MSILVGRLLLSAIFLVILTFDAFDAYFFPNAGGTKSFGIGLSSLVLSLIHI